MDPTAKNQVILRVTGLSQGIKEHIEKHPQFAGLYDIDQTSPKHSVRKRDIARLIVCRILPFVLDSFSHYSEDDVLLWECGLFDKERIDDGITEIDVRKAKALLQGMLKEIG